MGHMRWIAVLLLVPWMVQAAELTLGPRAEITHPGQGHAVHLSAPTVAVTRDQVVLVSWSAEETQGNQLYLARPTMQGAPVVRVNPAELTVESLHQAPGLAVGPGGEILSLVGLHQAETRGDPVCVGSAPVAVREWGPELRAAAADQ